MKIHKQILKLTDNQTLKLPVNAKILSVQIQYNEICMWYLFNDMEMLEERTFAIYGTGINISNDPGTYIGTVQMHKGSLVWHIFEKPD